MGRSFLIITEKSSKCKSICGFRSGGYRKRFEKYDLVILDELGYVSMDKNGCEMLFNLISSRNDKGSR